MACPLFFFVTPVSVHSLIHYAVSKMGPRFQFPRFGMPILDVLQPLFLQPSLPPWSLSGHLKGTRKSGCIRLKRSLHKISPPGTNGEFHVQPSPACAALIRQPEWQIQQGLCALEAPALFKCFLTLRPAGKLSICSRVSPEVWTFICICG